MSVFRIHKTKNYTVMSNVHLRDRRLSLKAKGLMSLMLSLPDDWRYSIKGLSSLCSSGESAVKTGLDELSELGYVRITKQYPSDGNSKITYSYDVFEDPGTVPEPESKPEKKKPDDIPYEEIIGLLNESAGTRFRHQTESYRKLIRGRFSDGYTLDDFKTVIRKKAAEWKGTEMESYLRPQTLFIPSHFDQYLNQPEVRTGGFDEFRSWG